MAHMVLAVHAVHAVQVHQAAQQLTSRSFGKLADVSYCMQQARCLTPLTPARYSMYAC